MWDFVMRWVFDGIELIIIGVVICGDGVVMCLLYGIVFIGWVVWWIANIH